MRFLCLGYYDPERFDTLSADEQAEIARKCKPHDEALHKTGRLHSVASLAHRKAVTLRPGKSKTSVTDGPFAETTELIGSFFIIEAEDMDDAIRVASLHPAAQWGEHLGFAIEVRPIDMFEQVSPESAGRRATV